jgi:ethylmalonyl-CoA/methylmalonyl-CoA decarboxylase
MLRPLVSLLSSPAARRPYYTGPAVPLDQIKEELAAIGGGGGSVDLEKDDRTGIARLTLNSPKSCNALSGSMMAQLADIMDELSGDGGWPEGRGLILTAAKNSANIFCAGGDLATVRRIGSHEQGFKMALLMNAVTRQLRSLPLITVALLDGSAVGGGAELVSCTDHRLVTPDSHVTFVQARVTAFYLE